MARKKKRRRTKRKQETPAWVWMLFGLSIGLAVALAVYLSSPGQPTNLPPVAANPAAHGAGSAIPEPSTSANPVNVEQAPAPAPQDTTSAEPRFDFYKMLPNYEVVIAEESPVEETQAEPEAIVEPGEYVLQAGSFLDFDDADRRRAELALHGIESTIQAVAINNNRYHRVWIGPTKDLDKLNTQRSRLRQANIDVLRIRLGD